MAPGRPPGRPFPTGSPGPARDRLIDAIVTYLARGDEAVADVRGAVAAEVDAAGPEALATLRRRLEDDVAWEYCPPDPLALRLHQRLAGRFLEPGSHVDGLGHLTALGDAPAILFANHLSYSDANVVQILLQQAGAGRLAGRLTALAGPKVYTSRQRRFSSLCFGTIRVPQSTEVSSEDAVLPAREVARAALRAIRVAHGRLTAGDALLLFAEGTRSRTARMQPLLPAVARYLEADDVDPWLVPVGLTGSERLFPIGVDSVQPACIVMRVGSPVRARAARADAGDDRQALMDAIGSRIAALLPAEYRGCYA